MSGAGPARRRPGARWIACAAALWAGAGCQIFVDSEVGAGIGAPCEEDADCQGSRCLDEVCAVECSAAGDCPAPSRCTAAGLCQLPLRVGFVYVGEPALEQWTEAHEIGRVEAQAALPYLETEVATGKLLPSDAVAAIDELVGRGVDLVVVNSSNLSQVAADKAAEHQDVKFLTCGGLVTSQNHVAYYGRMYQATYLAGYAAARRSASKRLGMIGSFVTPAVVQHINAFATGARRADAAAVVEVRWLGFWHDTEPPNAQGDSKERVLAEALLDSGCDVVAHQADNGIPVSAVADAGGAAKSIGNNVEDACPEMSPSCLGTTYWRWGPLYTQLFDDLHRSRWPGGGLVNPGIQVNPAESVVNFGVNASVVTNDLALELSGLLEELAGSGGAALPFAGPLCSTGQRDADGDGAPDCVAEGEAVMDQELRGMCWFVENVVEKQNPADPASADLPALVPETGDCAAQ